MERGNTTNPVQPEGTFTPMAEEQAASRPAAGGKLTEWQRFFLTRLDYMLGLQREHRAPDEASGTLLSKAVYSTYLDCQSQGVGEEALQRIGASGSSGEPSAN
ncbi:MAG TPA: hypothetical protein VK009_18120 [Chloroflexota bacterium]|nr:hypothetical protein [Chloroflexota bacterium]